MRTNKVVCLISFALGIGLLLGGCGTPGARPREGTLQVWTTWAGDPAPLQALLDRYAQEGGLLVQVTAGVKGARLDKALAGPMPPDLVILSGSGPVGSYREQGLIEPLDAWIEALGIDLKDLYAASLAQCEVPSGGPGGVYACLPWTSDVYALFWNKDLFRAAGLDPERPPQTMEELVTYAARLTVRDAKGDLAQIGFLPDQLRPHSELYARMWGGSEDAAAAWQRQFTAPYGDAEVKQFVLSFNRYASSNHPALGGKRLDCRQCHRLAPPNGNKLPARGFYEGKMAMLVGGEWLMRPNQSNVGVAPFPPPAGHPERADGAVVEGAVIVLPAGAQNKQAAAHLLAWMLSPGIAAEVAHAGASLPASRIAAQDPRFQQNPGLRVFLDLVDHPNARSAANPPLEPPSGG